MYKKIRADSENMSFVPARENALRISMLSLIERQRSAAKFISKMFSAFSYKDLLCYRTAYSTKNEIKNVPLCADVLKSLDETQRKIFDERFAMIEKLNGGARSEIKYGKGKDSKKSTRAETPENLTDLYFNMQRCFKRGAYADTLARFRRLCEGSVYYRLEHVYGINPADLNHSKKRGNLEMLQKFARI